MWWNQAETHTWKPTPETLFPADINMRFCLIWSQVVCQGALLFPADMNMCLKCVSCEHLWLNLAYSVTLHITFMGAQRAHI